MADSKKTTKKYYKLSERVLKSGKIKRTITIDDEVKPTERDLADIKLYIQCGYTISHKSQVKAEKARERIKNNGGRIGKKKKTETTENTAE
jgi:hypothetical protein